MTFEVNLEIQNIKSVSSKKKHTASQDTNECYGFKCGMKDKCQWRIYFSYDEPKKMFLVKTIYPNHICTPNEKCKILKSPIIGRLFMDKLRRNEDFMPLDIQEHIKEQRRFVSSRNQCQRGRGLALKLLEKEYDEQFAHLRGYAQELITSNKDSTVIVETTRGPKGEDVFAHFYVCFDILRRAWRGSFRPIIGLDGTFLKVAVKGVLLSAVGHDSNNQIYPIAWAVVQSENADNWLWFIKQIKTNLVLEDGTGFVILSDRSKGLINAVKSELPNVEHRMCVKHIIENLKKSHAKKDLLKPLVWNLAWSNNPTDYEENIQKLREYSMSLYEDVMKEQPKSWCWAFYRLGSFCEDVDNNATESFNSTIRKARTKAMVPMLETIRRQVMQRIMKRKRKANNHLGKISLYASKILALEKEDAERCKVWTGTHGYFDVALGINSCRVSLPSSTCTCGKWQISGIPCEHAYGAMMEVGLDVEDYVSNFFSTFLWQENYETSIIPARGSCVWTKFRTSLITAPPEPILPGRKKGGKKKKFPRLKGKHESPKKKKDSQKKTLGKEGRIIYCSVCKQAGHNAAGCKKNPKQKLKTKDKPPKKKLKTNTQDGSTSFQGQETVILLTKPMQISDE